MKVSTLLLIISLATLSIYSAHSQTIIHGGNVSGVWDLSGSPYHILEDISVPIGSTLIIEPGVEIESDRNVDIKIFGRLIASGSEGNPIIFSAINKEIKGWGGIEFHPSSTEDSEISKSIIEYALAGIWIYRGLPILNDLIIQHNSSGIFGFSQSVKPHIVQNIQFSGNEVGFYGDGGYESVFIKCNFFNNLNTAVYLDSHVNADDSLEFNRCLVYNNGEGITNYGSRRTILIKNCTIANNEGSEVFLQNGSGHIIENSILWGGEFEDGLVANLEVDVSYSNISLFNGIWPGEGNFNNDPLFIDEQNNDYTLNCTSPCINAGNPSSPLDPDGSINDMGVFPYNFSLLPGFASNDSPVCEGEYFTLFAGGGISYQWEGPNGFTSQEQNNLLTNVTANISGIYTVSITDNNGCEKVVETPVEINPNPDVTLTLPRDSFCINEPGIQLSGGNPSGGTYEGPGISGGILNPNFAGSGLHSVTYSFTDQNGCVGEAETVIKVSSQITPGVTISSMISEACEGEEIILVASPFAGGPNPEFQWYIDNQPAGVTSPVFKYNGVFGTHSIHCTMVTSLPCNTQEMASSNNLTITIHQKPNIDIKGELSFCEGESTTITASGGTTYEWNTGETSSSINITSPGNYSVTVTDDNSCENSTSKTVVKLPLPNVSFVLNLNDSICVNDPAVELMGGTPIGGSYSGPGITNGFFDPNTAGIGSHSITYTYQDPSTGCSNSATQNIMVFGGDCLTALSSITDEYSVIVFPNPSDGIFTVQFENWKDLKSIHLFDSQGRIIYTNETIAGLIQVNGIPRGSYFLKVISDEKVVVNEILVQ